MKIAIVCPYDLTRSGGVQEHVLAQAAELIKRGHNVKIVTPRPRGYKGKTPNNWIFIGNSAKVQTPIKTSVELGISFGRDTVDDMLGHEKFDLIHIHEPEVPVLGSQIVAKADCPIVATFHAMYPDTPMARTIETFRVPYSRSIFSRLRVMTAVSDAAAKFVREATKQPVTIIPNGIDLAKYHVQKKPEKYPTILYVGRLEKRKGVLYLLKAFKQLQITYPEVRLVIAGDGDLRVSLKQFVYDNNIKQVTFRGFVDDTEKLKLLASSRLFCSPALYGESFGIVLLEAMAAGVPVVAGDNPGYSSVLKDTGKLSLVDPHQTKEFARRLELLLFDEEIRKVWQNWASVYVKQFSYDKIVDQYEKLYKSLLK